MVYRKGHTHGAIVSFRIWIISPQDELCSTHISMKGCNLNRKQPIYLAISGMIPAMPTLLLFKVVLYL